MIGTMKLAKVTLVASVLLVVFIGLYAFHGIRHVVRCLVQSDSLRHSTHSAQLHRTPARPFVIMDIPPEHRPEKAAA